jgi:hypothetical protein
MLAAYQGIAVLYGNDYKEQLETKVIHEARTLETRHHDREGKHNDIDRVFNTMRKDGLTDAPIHFDHKNGSWSPGVEETLIKATNGSTGWQFFGMSASDGFHSVIVGVDRTGESPRLYWMDQYSRGFEHRLDGYLSSYLSNTSEATGKLDRVLTEVGTDRTTVWPLRNLLPFPGGR